MTIPRAEQIDLDTTSYYHCMGRCVRRSFLCGEQIDTGKDFSHRKEWIIARIKHLAQQFAIHVASYGIMSNHYHLVVFVNEEEALNWSDEEVRLRWSKIFWRDSLKIDDPTLTTKEKTEKIALWRAHLIDISWFMRCLNEYIARLANKEDEVTGRFWDGRFKCQALLDEGAILAAMAYADLNPIRAKIAKTPEESKFTSIQERIKWAKKRLDKQHLSKKTKLELKQIINEAPQPPLLMSFDNGKNSTNKITIDFTLSDYLQLVDETGRIIREDKRGSIPESLSPILERLHLKPQNWLEMLGGLNKDFSYAVGNAKRLTTFNNDRGKLRSIKGTGLAKKCYDQHAA